VRIALNLKGMDYEVIPVHLLKDGGEQQTTEYAGKNPNRLVPLFTDGAHTIHQSLAIIEYLEEIQATPSLLPHTAIDRAWVRAVAMDIAIEIHPLNNLRVLRYLIKTLGVSAEVKDTWNQHWMNLGLASLEKQLGTDPRVGHFAYGDQPGLIDICLVPQIFNALSAKLDMKTYPTLIKIFNECMKLPAFIDASWENQIDAVKHLIHACQQLQNIDLYIRIHPNMSNKSAQELKRWTDLSGVSVFVISPESEIDTYALIEASDVVTTAGSTVGIEAVFWGKPAIVLGPTTYDDLEAVYKPKNDQELINLLSIKNLAVRPESALPYGYYFKTFGHSFNFYEPFDLFNGRFMGEELH
jgi:maleylacetoacetate isomerase/maleylpyruvate isomerase